MENIIFTQIRERFHLETSGLKLRRQLEQNELALRRAQYDLRSAREAQALYEGSLRSFLHRLSGKKEARETSLRHDVQEAEFRLAAGRREKELLETKLPEIEAALEKLPSRESLRQQAEAFPESLREWNRLEALFCMEALPPMLEENHTALLELRRMMSGADMGKIYAYEEIAQIQSAPEQWGEACGPYVLRLEGALNALDLPFGPISYFKSPTAYVISAAAKHNQRDRLNEALSQVEEVRRQIPVLRRQLEHEG